jgi:hypothetical protein
MTHDSVDSTLADTPVSLVAAVTLLLQQYQHPRPEDWLQGVDPRLLQDGLDQPSQRMLINRYWRLQLSTVPNTMDLRFCLVDSGEISDWLRLFTTEVVPCIVQNNLPPATT